LAKENSKSSTENYGALVQKLEQVVLRLESGELSLEDSLQSFEEGIRLVRAGEKLLSEAEKRVEQLLSVDGELTAVALNGAESQAAPQAAGKPSTGKVAPSVSVDQGDDIPF
jgi:exodeoxyribonuclease VII small subunit